MNIAPSFNITVLHNGLRVEVNRNPVAAEIISEHSAGFLNATTFFTQNLELTNEQLDSIQQRAQTILDELYLQNVDSLSKVNYNDRMKAISKVIEQFNTLINLNVAQEEGEDAAQEVEAVIEVVEKQLDVIAYYLKPEAGSVPNPTKPSKPIYSEGTTTHLLGSISPQFLLPNGSLYVGTGIKGSDYNIARNNIIELAIMSHRRNAWEVGRIVNGNEVELKLTNDTDRWNITWSIGILETKIKNICEIYKVELILGTNADGTLSEGEQVHFILGPDTHNEAANSNYVFQEITGITNSVVDSAGSPDGMSVQNSSSHHWFKAKLNPVIASNKAVVGKYAAILKATHKVSGNVVETQVYTTAALA